MPREIIALLNEAVRQQIEAIERGDSPPESNLLFTGAAIKAALPEVSRKRLEQTLYAEFPKHKRSIEKLRGQHSDQTIANLAQLWDTTPIRAKQTADALLSIGFFEQREGTYWVPFLYRPALELIQGKGE